jgi:hypothetical protein
LFSRHRVSKPDLGRVEGVAGELEERMVGWGELVGGGADEDSLVHAVELVAHDGGA